MKKSIVIALILVFSIAGNVFAAGNSFSNVPKDHWAYGAVSQLAKDGIFDGYADGSFQGDKTLTRYEMAQVVAKALNYEGKINAETKANLDKLSAEFETELTNLGVRVNKLEKRASSIKFTGDSRDRWQSNYALNGATKNGVHTNATDRFQLRVRLLMDADVNEKVKFDGVIGWQNQNGLSGTSTPIGRNSVAQIERANFTFQDVLPKTSMTLGRMGDTLGATGVAWDVPGGWFDGGRFNYSNKNIKAMIGYGDMGAQQDSGLPAPSGFGTNWAPQAATVGQLAWNVNKTFTVYGAAIHSNSNTYRIEDNIFGVKATVKDFTLAADYVHNNWDFGSDKVQPNATYAKLNYKGASANKPGSWGLYIDYRKIGGQSIDTRLMTNNVAGTGAYPGAVNTADGLTKTGAKGFGYGFTYGFTKGATLLGTVETLKSYDGATKFDNFYSLTTNISF